MLSLTFDFETHRERDEVENHENEDDHVLLNISNFTIKSNL